MAHQSESQELSELTNWYLVNELIFKARYDAMRKELNLLSLLYRKSTFRLLPVKRTGLHKK